MKPVLCATVLLLSLPTRNILGQESENLTIRIQSGETVRGLENNKKQPAQPLTNHSIVRLVAVGLGEV